MGKIFLEGMEFYAKHGYYPEERIIGNKYSVDVCLEADFLDGANRDRLDGTINYEKVYKIVTQMMNIKAFLLEHLAYKIVKELKKQFPEIISITVKVSKYNPPIKGLCQRVTVELSG